MREGRNLALCAQTSMGLTHDRDPTMMCDLSGRLFNVPLVTMGELVRRRIVRKLLVWRPAPANRPTPSRDLTTHIGTSLVPGNLQMIHGPSGLGTVPMVTDT